MSKKRMFIGIIILCLMAVAIFCINDYRHQEYYHDIEKIVSECIKGNIDSNAIVRLVRNYMIMYKICIRNMMA